MFRARLQFHSDFMKIGKGRVNGQVIGYLQQPCSREARPWKLGVLVMFCARFDIALIASP